MSVGGNGGSFAVGYWDNIKIPNVDDAFMDKLTEIYSAKAELNPMEFNIESIKTAGIYELNNFLIKCKAILSALCSDLKIGKVKTESEYRELI